MAAEAKDEFMAQINAMFDKMDTNGDGKIDKEEFKAAMEADGGPSVPEDAQAEFANFLQECDTDADGKVSRAEFLTFFENMFNQIAAALGAAE